MMQKFDQAWEMFIRPTRQSYSIEDLGNKLQVFGQFKSRRSDFEILNKSKQTLQCSLFEPMHLTQSQESLQKYPCVVYCHCNSGSRLEAIRILPEIIKRGMALFCFDFAGSGLSDGDYVTLGINESVDLECVVAHLIERPQVTSISLWGRSMGAVTNILYASRSLSHKYVKAIIFDSGFSNLKVLSRNLAKTRIGLPNLLIDPVLSRVGDQIKERIQHDIQSIDLAKVIHMIYVPCYFLTSKEDSFVRSEHVEQLHTRYNGQKWIEYIQGEHNAHRSNKLIASLVAWIATMVFDQNYNSNNNNSIQNYHSNPPTTTTTNNDELPTATTASASQLKTGIARRLSSNDYHSKQQSQEYQQCQQQQQSPQQQDGKANTVFQPRKSSAPIKSLNLLQKRVNQLQFPIDTSKSSLVSNTLQSDEYQASPVKSSCVNTVTAITTTTTTTTAQQQQFSQQQINSPHVNPIEGSALLDSERRKGTQQPSSVNSFRTSIEGSTAAIAAHKLMQQQQQQQLVRQQHQQQLQVQQHVTTNSNQKTQVQSQQNGNQLISSKQQLSMPNLQSVKLIQKELLPQFGLEMSNCSSNNPSQSQSRVPTEETASRTDNAEGNSSNNSTSYRKNNLLMHQANNNNPFDSSNNNSSNNINTLVVGQQSQPQQQSQQQQYQQQQTTQQQQHAQNYGSMQSFLSNNNVNEDISPHERFSLPPMKQSTFTSLNFEGNSDSPTATTPNQQQRRFDFTAQSVAAASMPTTTPTAIEPITQQSDPHSNNANSNNPTNQTHHSNYNSISSSTSVPIIRHNKGESSSGPNDLALNLKIALESKRIAEQLQQEQLQQQQFFTLANAQQTTGKSSNRDMQNNNQTSEADTPSFKQRTIIAKPQTAHIRLSNDVLNKRSIIPNSYTQLPTESTFSESSSVISAAAKPTPTENHQPFPAAAAAAAAAVVGLSSQRSMRSSTCFASTTNSASKTPACNHSNQISNNQTSFEPTTTTLQPQQQQQQQQHIQAQNSLTQINHSHSNSHSTHQFQIGHTQSMTSLESTPKQSGLAVHNYHHIQQNTPTQNQNNNTHNQNQHVTSATQLSQNNQQHRNQLQQQSTQLKEQQQSKTSGQSSNSLHNSNPSVSNTTTTTTTSGFLQMTSTASPAASVAAPFFSSFATTQQTPSPQQPMKHHIGGGLAHPSASAHTPATPVAAGSGSATTNSQNQSSTSTTGSMTTFSNQILQKTPLTFALANRARLSKVSGDFSANTQNSLNSIFQASSSSSGNVASTTAGGNSYSSAQQLALPNKLNSNLIPTTYQPPLVSIQPKIKSTTGDSLIQQATEQKQQQCTGQQQQQQQQFPLTQSTPHLASVSAPAVSVPPLIPIVGIQVPSEYNRRTSNEVLHALPQFQQQSMQQQQQQQPHQQTMKDGQQKQQQQQQFNGANNNPPVLQNESPAKNAEFFGMNKAYFKTFDAVPMHIPSQPQQQQQQQQMQQRTSTTSTNQLQQQQQQQHQQPQPQQHSLSQIHIQHHRLMNSKHSQPSLLSAQAKNLVPMSSAKDKSTSTASTHHMPGVSNSNSYQSVGSTPKHFLLKQHDHQLHSNPSQNTFSSESSPIKSASLMNQQQPQQPQQQSLQSQMSSSKR